MNIAHRHNCFVSDSSQLLESNCFSCAYEMLLFPVILYIVLSITVGLTVSGVSPAVFDSFLSYDGFGF